MSRGFTKGLSRRLGSGVRVCGGLVSGESAIKVCGNHHSNAKVVAHIRRDWMIRCTDIPPLWQDAVQPCANHTDKHHSSRTEGLRDKTKSDAILEDLALPAFGYRASRF
jgi:hypothetical protein